MNKFKRLAPLLKKKRKNVITGIRNHWKGEELRAEIKAVSDSVTEETLAKITKTNFFLPFKCLNAQEITTLMSFT